MGKRHGVQPQNGIPGFSLHFPKELSYGYLRFEGNVENSFGKVGKNFRLFGCLILVLLNWDSQQGRPFSLTSQRNFPISFKPKVAIADFFWKIAKKNLVFHFGGGRHASFHQKPVVNFRHISFMVPWLDHQKCLPPHWQNVWINCFKQQCLL